MTSRNTKSIGTKRKHEEWEDAMEVGDFFRSLGMHASQQDAAVKCCKDQFICTVGDLRLVAREPEMLKETFPPIGIRARVQAWHDQEATASEATTNNPSALTLPPVLDNPNLGKSGKKNTKEKALPKSVLCSNKGVHISSCVKHLHEMGVLSGLDKLSHLENHLIPPVYYEKQHVRYLLEVVEKVVTDEELKLLQENPNKKKEKTSAENGDDDETDMDELYKSIEVRAMDKMWEYEGKDPAVERGMQRKRAGSRYTPTYLGFGKRVKRYKNEMLKFLEESCSKNQTEMPPKNLNLELRERDDWLTKWDG